jgi:gamma-glutamyltranspeptidase/glutathione hydrolase
MTRRIVAVAFLGLLIAMSSQSVVMSQTDTLVRPEPAQKVQQQHTASSSKNMVASVHPLATQAGIDAFANGGNAVDAAIATALTLGVVDNFNSGIGGGCFILIRTADGKVVAIDGREMAPMAAHKNLYRDYKGSSPKPSQIGALASGVPGALMAYSEAIEKYGRLNLAKAIQPGTIAARDGFVVTDAYASKLRGAKKAMLMFPETVDVFFRYPTGGDEKQLYGVGEKLKQTDLAATYQAIGEYGTDWFYDGKFGQLTEDWMKANEGIMTADDLRNYHTVNRKPIRTTYRGYEIVGFPPPSSGGVHVSQVLNILENFDLKQLYENEPATMYHVVAEAMKLAFADRAHWLGDPDFVNVPIGLIDKQYANQLAQLIDLKKVITAQHGDPPDANTKFFEKHTTHVATADAEGNWVAITTTVNTGFGAKYVVPGTGVIMNNQMDDFAVMPGVPNAFGLVGGDNNAVESKKRPLSSMSPTIVLKDGEPVLTVGGAGGPKIITEVLWAIVNHLDLEMPIGEAIAQPRLHHQWAPTDLMLESNFDKSLADELTSRGHKIRRSRSMGICQGISFDPVSKKFTGAHDPRTSGKAGGQ